MATLIKQLQDVVESYMSSGEPWPASTTQIAKWAIKTGRYKLQPSTIINQCADQLSRAMREEHIKDKQGRIVRAKHVARVSRNGEQIALWADIRTANREHMEIAFQQRRKQIVGDCRQLKTDVDSYNDNANIGVPIQMVFDFTYDLAEAEMEMAS
jgi:hypothetical protein